MKTRTATEEIQFLFAEHTLMTALRNAIPIIHDLIDQALTAHGHVDRNPDKFSSFLALLKLELPSLNVDDKCNYQGILAIELWLSPPAGRHGYHHIKDKIDIMTCEKSSDRHEDLTEQYYNAKAAKIFSNLAGKLVNIVQSKSSA